MPGAVTAGMDIPAVRNLAAEMQKAADETQAIMQRVTARLESTPWLGQDRTKFEQDWRGRQTQQLNQVMQALRDGSRIAIANANEQEATSNR